jgi:hypothetical protein
MALSRLQVVIAVPAIILAGASVYGALLLSKEFSKSYIQTATLEPLTTTPIEHSVSSSCYSANLPGITTLGSTQVM